MPDTGILYATGASVNAAVGTVDWSNPTNCIGNVSNASATANGSLFDQITKYLQYDFSLSSSSSDIVVGMVFSNHRACDGGNSYDNSVKMLVNGSYSPTDKATSSAWFTGASTNLNWAPDYGSSTDMWGFSAGSITGSSTFKICVAGDLSDKHDTLYIGNAQLTIYYTPAGSSAVKIKTVYVG